jgi:Domain of unknown function (DUF5122) beta-propeller
MYRCFTRGIAAAIALFGMLSAHADFGTHDPSFATLIEKPVSYDVSDPGTTGSSATVDWTGRLVTVFFRLNRVLTKPIPNDTENKELVVARRYPNGKPDTLADDVPNSSFGPAGDGNTVLAMPAGVTANDLYCVPGVTAGGYTYVVSCTDSLLIVWRLEPFNGLPDINFGTNGVKTFPLYVRFPIIATTDSGGRLLVAAGTRETPASTSPVLFTVMQITHGAFDREFAGTGIVRIPFFPGSTTERSYATDIKFERNWQHIVVGGRTSANGAFREFALARLSPNGALDTTFGSNGTTRFPVATGENLGRKFDFDSYGRIVMTGSVTYAQPDPSTPNGQFRIGVARILPSGALDNSFGNGFGRAVLAYDNRGGTDSPYTPAGPCVNVMAYDIVVHSFGPTAATEQISIAANCTFATYPLKDPAVPLDDLYSGFVMRLNANGSLASNFGGDKGVAAFYSAAITTSYRYTGFLNGFARQRRGWNVGDYIYLYGGITLCPANARCWSVAYPDRLLPAVPASY